MFDQYDIGGTKHSSSDGQRIETQIPTINARHGSKYFGLKKGVSAYTLVANHVPCNARIIGTHEHESHFVFDILHNNTTDIQPERHSTDTHGTNQVNFWLLFCDGQQFAPRYRDPHKKTASLVGVRHPNHYADCLIKPARKTRDALIVREWPNIQRIVASLMQKDVTQSIGRAQAQLVHPAERDEESDVGTGQHPENHLCPGLHRRSSTPAKRAESAQPGRVLPPDASRYLLRQLGQVPRQE
jgi:TnpA family transposase